MSTIKPPKSLQADFLSAHPNLARTACSLEEMSELWEMLDENQDVFTQSDGSISLDNFSGIKTLVMRHFSAVCTHAVMDEYLLSFCERGEKALVPAIR